MTAAQRLAAALEQGPIFVSLAPLRQSDGLLPAIAAALSVSVRPEGSLLHSIALAIGERRVLLLDNFEQIVEAAHEVSALLERCPHLHVLATSRVALRSYGEQRLPIPPLPLPPLVERLAIDDLIRCDPVRLFVDRARAVLPDFELNTENASDVAAICNRLDGLPLSIELAAARIDLLTSEALLARLDRRLDLLTNGPRGVATRHETLRDAISWSYDLLSVEQQTLFHRVAVFAGGFELAQCEWAWNALGGDTTRVLDSLTALVERSLVALDASTGRRFLMLETIREFALERLEESGEGAEVRRVHAAAHTALAEQAEYGIAQLGCGN